MVICGIVRNALPDAPATGWTVKTIEAATPVILKALLVTEGGMKPEVALAVAVRVTPLW